MQHWPAHIVDRPLDCPVAGTEVFVHGSGRMPIGFGGLAVWAFFRWANLWLRVASVFAVDVVDVWKLSSIVDKCSVDSGQSAMDTLNPSAIGTRVTTLRLPCRLRVGVRQGGNKTPNSVGSPNAAL